MIPRWLNDIAPELPAGLLALFGADVSRLGRYRVRIQREEDEDLISQLDIRERRLLREEDVDLISQLDTRERRHADM